MQGKLEHKLEKTQVILVDEFDQKIGLGDKEEVHKTGQLHRAFSVFLFNENGEMLLQKRADDKYHSPGLWSNTCCSHPIDGISLEDAALKRLQEEMGIQTDLDYSFSFLYKEEVGNGMIEHEFDHIFLGIFNDEPVPDSKEVSDWKYVSLDEVESELDKTPEVYTAWFNLLFYSVCERLFD